jgi:ribosomal protein S18 acetylase RimI-like enzyme
MDTIRPATLADLEGVVDTLTTSFHDDPVMVWSYPDAQIRPRRLATLWRFLAEGLYLPGGACTVSGDHDAVALWRASEDHRQEQFWADNSERFAIAMEGDLERMAQLSEAMGVHHPSDPHWYLLALGVTPELQGRGLGSRLLAHTLDRIDTLGQATYLEATSLRSRVLYERHGFEIIAEFSAPQGPPVWSMWRAPV